MNIDRMLLVFSLNAKKNHRIEINGNCKVNGIFTK